MNQIHNTVFIFELTLLFMYVRLSKHQTTANNNFWRSQEHAAAIQLREGHVDSHFVVAVEASE